MEISKINLDSACPVFGKSHFVSCEGQWRATAKVQCRRHGAKTTEVEVHIATSGLCFYQPSTAGHSDEKAASEAGTKRIESSVAILQLSVLIYN